MCAMLLFLLISHHGAQSKGNRCEEASVNIPQSVTLIDTTKTSVHIQTINQVFFVQ